VVIRQNQGSNTDGGIIINTTKAPFDNIKVRQALKHGVNQQGIIDGLYRGQGKWSGFVGNGLTTWALPDAETKQLYRHDPELSKRLLAEAGFPNGITGELMVFSGYSQNYIDTAEVMIADLKKANINLTMKLEQVAAGRKAVEDGNFTLNNSAHITGLEPDEFVKDGVIPGGSRNFFRINDPKLTELANKQTVIVDVAERQKVVYEAQRYIAELSLIVPIPTQSSYSAIHGYVKNYYPDNIAGDECIEQFFWLEK
jgi:ABC-type transport system substrate-binding protein